MIPRRLSAALLLVGAAAAGTPVVAQGPAPSWVSRRPVDPTHYIGIGSTAKAGFTGGHLARARAVALADMSAEVVANVSSTFLRKQYEDASTYTDETRATLRTSTMAKLEGYELVGTWEDADRFWAYYRLDKQRWEETRYGASGRARQQAYAMVEAARRQEKQDPVAAMRSYLGALLTVQQYFGEPLFVNDGMERADVGDLAVNGLQQLASGMRFDVQGASQAVQRAQAPLSLEATLHLGGTPVPGMPMTCTFAAGGGLLGDVAPSGPGGEVRCPVRKIGSTVRNAAVEARPDAQALITADSVSDNIVKLVNALPFPTARWALTVGGPREP